MVRIDEGVEAVLVELDVEGVDGVELGTGDGLLVPSDTSKFSEVVSADSDATALVSVPVVVVKDESVKLTGSGDSGRTGAVEESVPDELTVADGEVDEGDVIVVNGIAVDALAGDVDVSSMVVEIEDSVVLLSVPAEAVEIDDATVVDEVESVAVAVEVDVVVVEAERAVEPSKDFVVPVAAGVVEVVCPVSLVEAAPV